MRIDVEFDDSEIRIALNRLLEKTGNLRPALAEIGEELQESTKRRFTTQVGADGVPWLPNSPLVIKRKGPDFKPPLTGKTGLLKHTIHYNLLGNFALDIGSPMEYSVVQQFGGLSYWQEYEEWWDVPDRPFIGADNYDLQEIIRIINKHLTL